MNYSIQFKNTDHPFLSISSRKKTLKHKLISVTKGIVLVKVGKNEYAVKTGHYFWIPADCLVSITVFPLSIVSQVEFSQRLPDPFEQKIGHVNVSSMVQNAFTLLEQSSTKKNYAQILLQVIRYELTNITPQLTMCTLSQQFNNWSPKNDSGLDVEINLSLKLREARKNILSGMNPEHVAKTLFNLPLSQFNILCELGLGVKL